MLNDIEDEMNPRIPPIPTPERNEEVAELLGTRLAGELEGRPPLNITATFARHPALFRAFMPFVQYLADGALPARDRELVVVRTAMHCQSPYAWAHHCAIARRNGVSDEEIDELAQGDTADWTAHDQALLAAADELHEKSVITDPTWNTLCVTFDDAQMIELVVLVGQFHLVAGVLNSAGTPLDEWLTDVRPFPRKEAGASSR